MSIVAFLTYINQEHNEKSDRSEIICLGIFYIFALNKNDL